MPRSQRITFLLPPASTYSADSSHSSIVAEMPRFSSTGFVRAAELPQQREVLHVARADLQDVGVAFDELDLADLHHFGDELQIVPIGRGAQHAQPCFPESLEAVGRAARLERAAAQDLGARRA